MANNRLDSPLRGIVPPLVTPLTSDEELDREALVRLVQHVLSGGVNGLFVLGTTGEGPSLPYRVRAAMIEATCEVASGRAPVLVGVTDTSLAEAIDMAEVAADGGADAVVFAPPCYFPIDQADLVIAARRLAQESPLPVMLYNMPALTKAVFEPETVRELLDEPKVIGLKDSSGDLAYFERVQSVIHLRSDWTLMAGPEHLLAETVALGGDGGVCGGANLYPGLFVALYEACVADRTDEVRRLKQLVERLSKLYTLGRNPALAVIQGVKAGLAQRGICSSRLCSPFSALCNGESRAVRELLADIDASLTADPAEVSC
ncbi:dihydrodipicolinate synthase family protein [Botrimarina sp.]|uniref:dihydrodipicolinate synthase family protein n=1 Tax=Botrimarina sp. TaxID=2795802 RepID=UPI0032EA9BF7